MNPPHKESFIIQGLDGQKKLDGEISIEGAKNAILPLIAAAIAVEGISSFTNVPEIEDVSRMEEILAALGVKAVHRNNAMTIDPSGFTGTRLPRDIAKRMRASVFLTGPILAKKGRVDFPHPGGCVIGARPIDIFVDGFQRMGAAFTENDEFYSFAAKGRLRGASIFLKIPSVSATETFMIAASLADGRTTIKNSAMEPEIDVLARYLRSCGANIFGEGSPTIVIEGVESLQSPKEPFNNIPDRIEAGSFLILGALAAKNLTLKNVEPKHLEAVIFALQDSGVPISVGDDTISISDNETPNNEFKSFNIKTHEYPGFPTDLQAPSVIFLTQSTGESTVFETIFEGRLNFTEDLVRMGADIKLWDAHRATVRGPTHLKGRELEGPDIRAGLAFVIAGLIAKGESTISNVYYIDRGYEKIETRLSKLGASIQRVSE